MLIEYVMIDIYRSYDCRYSQKSTVLLLYADWSVEIGEGVGSFSRAQAIRSRPSVIEKEERRILFISRFMQSFMYAHISTNNGICGIIMSFGSIGLILASCCGGMLGIVLGMTL